MEFAVRALRAWAVPYVVPVAAAARVFDPEGRIHDQAVEQQLKTLGGEVVRVAERFADDESLHRASECERSSRARRRRPPETRSPAEWPGFVVSAMVAAYRSGGIFQWPFRAGAAPFFSFVAGCCAALPPSGSSPIVGMNVGGTRTWVACSKS